MESLIFFFYEQSTELAELGGTNRTPSSSGVCTKSPSFPISEVEVEGIVGKGRRVISISVSNKGKDEKIRILTC